MEIDLNTLLKVIIEKEQGDLIIECLKQQLNIQNNPQLGKHTLVIETTTGSKLQLVKNIVDNMCNANISLSYNSITEVEKLKTEFTSIGAVCYIK